MKFRWCLKIVDFGVLSEMIASRWLGRAFTNEKSPRDGNLRSVCLRGFKWGKLRVVPRVKRWLKDGLQLSFIGDVDVE